MHTSQISRQCRQADEEAIQEKDEEGNSSEIASGVHHPDDQDKKGTSRNVTSFRLCDKSTSEQFNMIRSKWCWRDTHCWQEGTNCWLQSDQPEASSHVLSLEKFFSLYSLAPSSYAIMTKLVKIKRDWTWGVRISWSGCMASLGFSLGGMDGSLLYFYPNAGFD